jgi:integrase/recombinase XerD
MIVMAREQETLFNQRGYRGQKPQAFVITPPSADQTVLQTLPAYFAYLSNKSRSEHTPGDYKADMKLFGQFTRGRALSELQPVDLQQWIATLKATMPAKTINRKVSALGNYFRWLTFDEIVFEKNPAGGIRAHRVTAPLPDLLYENECDELLRANSTDPRTYLLILLVLETGMKKAELLTLGVADFDFSDKYQPVLLIKHSGRETFKDRKLRLPVQIVPVFDDYVQRYNVAGLLYPYTERFLSTLLTDAGKRARLTRKVTASMLRDLFVVRGVKRGEKLDDLFEKIGLSKNSFDDARKKYGRLTSKAL